MFYISDYWIIMFFIYTKKIKDLVLAKAAFIKENTNYNIVN